MKDFVKYDLALKLKEKGFGYDLPITYDYKNQTYQHHVEPMIYQVLDWLRIEKNIDIVIYPIDASTLYMGGEKYILSIIIMQKEFIKFTIIILINM